MNGETSTFADIFIAIDGEFTTTFTFSMNINSQIYWCNTFNDIFYTTILAGKKINIVPNFTKTFMRFNVYGRISSSGYVLILLLKKVIDPDSSNNLHSIILCILYMYIIYIYIYIYIYILRTF